MKFKAGWYYLLYEKKFKTHVVDLYQFESQQEIDDEIKQLNDHWPNTKIIVAKIVQGELTHTDDDSIVIIK